MNDRPEGSFTALNPSIGTGSHSMAKSAPIGAVSRRDRERAGRTALHREGSNLYLDTSLPGNVQLQRRAPDGSWETIYARSAARLGRTKIDLPDDGATSPATTRVVFLPKNVNIPAWTSEIIDR